MWMVVTGIYWLSSFFIYKIGYYRGLREGHIRALEMQAIKDNHLIENIKKALEKEGK